MKRIIKDEVFVSELKTKANAWLAEQSGNNSRLPDIEIIEVSEYPVYNLTLKALVETRQVGKFSKPGAAQVKKVTDAEPQEDIDPWSVECEVSKEFTAGKHTVDVPATITSVRCMKCEGSGEAQCPECQGQKTVYCLHCRGDGKLACEKCRKTLKVNCPSCQGRGKIYSETSQKYENCAQCEGVGSFPCKDCQNGFVTCSACEGKGRTTCQACKEKGSLSCTTCAGMGNIISGKSIEITTSVLGANYELKNRDIPEDIVSNVLAFLRFAPEKTVEIETGKTLSGLLSEAVEAIPELESRLSLSADGKVLRKALTVEKKFYYNAVYKVGGAQNSVWFILSAGKFVCEKKLLQQLYSGTVTGLNEMLKKGDYMGAIALAKSVNNIPVIKADAERIVKEAEKQLSLPYYKGGLLGFAVTLLAALPLAFYLWRHSFHLWLMVLITAICALVSATVAVLLFNFLKPRQFDTIKKRLVGTTGLAVLPVVVVFSIGILLRLDPAKYFDASRMRDEYSAYFPFGRRTLVNKEDIKFLQALTEKYSRTGIDLSSAYKELKWMVDKQKSDEFNMAKIERTAKAIERIREDREPVRARHKRKTYKTLPRIYIN